MARAEEMSNRYSQQIALKINAAMESARTMASIFEGIKQNKNCVRSSRLWQYAQGHGGK
jgi:hypothetical protein